MPVILEPKPAMRGMMPCDKAIRDPLIPRTAPCLLAETLLLMSATILTIESPLETATTGMRAYKRKMLGTIAYNESPIIIKNKEERSMVHSEYLFASKRRITPCVKTIQSPITPKNTPIPDSAK